MNKVILVIDDPKRCINCPLARYKHMGGWLCGGTQCKPIDIDRNERPDWCPLIPAPEEQDVWFDDERSDWERGYNNCLREIIRHEFSKYVDL